jgi:4-hydroxybenzoate polyprenyltransferase
MKNVISIVIIVVAFFFPWIALALAAIPVAYLIYTYFYMTKRTKVIIKHYNYEILDYFEDRLGQDNPLTKYLHLSYISKNSYYFLYPASAKVFASLLSRCSVVLFIIGLMYYVKFDETTLYFGLVTVALIIASMIYSQKYQKPIWDYRNRNMPHISNNLRDGLEEYPNFFYHGEWARIQAQR